MKRLFLAIVMVFIVSIFAVTIVLAHPPTDVNLSYDVPSQTLHIAMTHVTSNMVQHHIRKLTVYKNDEVILDRTVVRQTTPQVLEEDVLLTAAAGDIIRVKAICNEGGIVEQTLIIPAEDKDQE